MADTTKPITGTSSDDTLIGTESSDKINAGDGDDVVNAGAGSDTVRLGDGNDTLIHTLAENWGETDIYYAGEGIDTLVIDLSNIPNAADYQAAFQYAFLQYLSQGTQSGYDLSLGVKEYSDMHDLDLNTGFHITIKQFENIQFQGIETNQPPSLEPIAAQTISAGSTLTFTAVATDPDPQDTLTYSLTGAPPGASIDSTSGIFTWTPTTSGDYSFDIVVTDNGTPALYDSETITVTVTSSPIYGTEGADYLVGTSGNDIIFGLGGDDTIDGGEGRDYIDAGLGNDVIIFNSLTDYTNTIIGGNEPQHVELSRGDILDVYFSNAINGLPGTLDLGQFAEQGGSVTGLEVIRLQGPAGQNVCIKGTGISNTTGRTVITAQDILDLADDYLAINNFRIESADPSQPYFLNLSGQTFEEAGEEIIGGKYFNAYHVANTGTPADGSTLYIDANIHVDIWP